MATSPIDARFATSRFRPRYAIAALVIVGLIAAMTIVAFPVAKTTVSHEADIADGHIAYQNSKLTLQLESNASTGYSWLSSTDGDSTVVADERYIVDETTDENGEVLVGAPGTYQVTYVGIDEGTTELTLNYARSWEDGKPAKTITLNVDTDEDGNIESVMGCDSDQSEIVL